MSRPRYEKPKHREARKEARREIERILGVECHDNTADPRINTIFLKGEHIVTYADIRPRDNPSTAYRDVMLSERDFWDPAMQLLRKLQKAGSKVPVLAVSVFTDGIYYLKLDLSMDDKVERRVGGRKDRGDEYDQEMCRFPLTSWFKRMEDVGKPKDPEPVQRDLL